MSLSGFLGPPGAQEVTLSLSNLSAVSKQSFSIPLVSQLSFVHLSAFFQLSFSFLSTVFELSFRCISAVFQLSLCSLLALSLKSLALSLYSFTSLLSDHTSTNQRSLKYFVLFMMKSLLYDC